MEAVIYAIAAAASFLIFPLFWNRPFGQGVHFHAFVARSRWWVLAAIGVATSVVVQVLSNFLPIPKELPIDKFFTHPLGVWLIAVFGVTVAPAFEELAFRGFLLPSLASAWDWVVQGRVRRRYAGESGGSLTGEWQQQAPVYSSLPPDGASVFQAAGTEPDAGNTMRDSGYSDPRWSLPALVFSTIVTSIGFAMLHGAQLAHSFAPLSVLFAVSVVLCITRLRFHSLTATPLFTPCTTPPSLSCSSSAPTASAIWISWGNKARRRPKPWLQSANHSSRARGPDDAILKPPPAVAHSACPPVLQAGRLPALLRRP